MMESAPALALEEVSKRFGRIAAVDGLSLQVEPGRMNQQSFENVGMFPQMRPSHSAGVVAVSETPFHQLAATTHQ